MRSALYRLLIGIEIVITLLASSGTSRAQSPASAKALEARLYAPCCYGGTLDIHESELARGLRAEIDLRLAGGESSDAIQSDFVARYGERVLAARSDTPIRTMGLGLALVALFSAVGLFVLLRRWTRQPRTAEAPAGAVARGPRDELDAIIDAELAELDS